MRTSWLVNSVNDVCSFANKHSICEQTCSLYRLLLHKQHFLYPFDFVYTSAIDLRVVSYLASTAHSSIPLRPNSSQPTKLDRGADFSSRPELLLKEISYEHSLKACQWKDLTQQAQIGHNWCHQAFHWLDHAFQKFRSDSHACQTDHHSLMGFD